MEHTLDWWWTVDHGGKVLLARGLEQNYMLTQATASPVVLRPSSGSSLTLNDGAPMRAVLAAMDEFGAPLWQIYLSAESLETTAVASIDGVDGVFISGNFQGTLRANEGGGTDLELEGAGRDSFVLRVNAAGTVQTVAHLTDHGDAGTIQRINDIAVTPGGVVFAIGLSRGDFSSTDGGSAVLTGLPPGRDSQFVVRLGPASRGILTPIGSPWDSIVVDDESVYVGTRIADDTVLDGVEYGAIAEFVPLIASRDHDLAFRWVQTPLDESEGSGEDEPMRLHSGNGRIFVGHTFTEMHNFGGHLVDAGGYIASLSVDDGTVAWARALGVFTPDVGTAGNRVYFAGTGIGTVDLGGGSLGAAVGRDALVGVLQNTGEYESARRFGGLDQEVASEVQPTSAGIMVSGTWSDDMNVDGVMFRASETQDAFLFHFAIAMED
ncbi:MAG: hypothetical protein AB8H86_27515 [Polyangiales bacterium]